MLKIIFILFVTFLFSQENFNISKLNSDLLKRLDSHEITYINQKKLLNVFVENQWAPYNYIENGEIKGFSNEYISYVAQIIGLKVNFINNNEWNDLIKRLLNGEIDVINNVKITPERSKKLLFSDQSQFNVVDAFLTLNQKIQLANFNQLKHKKLAIVHGYFQEEILRKFYPEIELVKTKNTLDSFYKVLNGEVDAALDNHSVFDFHIRKNKSINLISVPINDNPTFRQTPLYIAFAGKNKILKGIVDKAIDIIPDTTFTRMLNTWKMQSHNNKTLKIDNSFTAVELEYIKNNPVLKINYELDWAPYNFVENEQIKGFSNDYIQLIAKEIGFKLEYVLENDWSKIIADIESGKIDVINNIKKTDYRLKHLNYTNQPIFDIVDGLLIKKEEDVFNTFESLSRKKLAVVRGFFHEELVRKNYPEIEIVIADDAFDCINKVLIGEADAAVETHSVFQYYLKKYFLTELMSIPLTNHDVFKVDPVYLAVKKDNSLLLSILNKAMNNLSIRQTQDLYNRWIDRNSEELISNKDNIKFTNNEITYLKNKKQITMVVDPDWLPLESIDNGKHIGISAEFFDIFQKKLPIPIVLMPTTNWGASIDSAKSRKADIFSLAMPTEERRMFMDFTEPYVSIPLVLVGRPEMPFIDDITLLNNMKFGIVEGYAFNDILKKKFPKMTIIDLKSLDEGFKKVIDGELEGVIDALSVVGYKIQNFYSNELQIVGKFDERWELGVATRNDEPLLKPIFDKIIASISKSEKQEIINKWISVNYVQQTNYTLLWQILAVVGVFIAILIWRFLILRKFNVTLKEQNEQIILQSNQLIETEKKLLFTQYAVNSSAFPIIWVLDSKTLTESKIISANQAACDILGYENDHLLKLSLKDIDVSLTDDEWNKIAHNPSKDSNNKSLRTSFKKHNGITIPVDLYSSFYEFDDVAYQFLFFADISNQIALENKLQHTAKMEAIGTLAGGIAHDFNNILAAIMGYAELVKFDLQEGSHTYNNISQVVKAGNRAKELVKQILTFGRKDQEPNSPIDPITVAKEALTLLRASIPTSITIIENIDESTKKILADPTKLHQIIINLMTNAKHAIEDNKGEISFSLRNVYLKNDPSSTSSIIKGEFIEIRVTDNGRGIHPEIKDRIFEPYFTTNAIGEGSGMGLSLVHSIVKSFDGFVYVESEINKGSTFIVNIPVIDGDVNSSYSQKDTQIPRGSEHILVVDDEETIVEMYKATLEFLGYKVTGKLSSKRTLELFNANPDQFDLIISDQTMPEMLGSELAIEILKIKPKLPFILCTGFSAVVSELEAKEIGIAKFILKPFTTQQLAKVIRDVLDKKV